MNDLIRVVLADDHTLVRQSLSRLLNEHADMQVTADVGSADEAVEACLRQGSTVDVVLLDIDMPGIAAFDAARTIIARCPGAKVIFLSAFTHERYIQAALACGAMGYLCKTEPPEKVIKAIRSVAAGQSYFSPEVQSRLVVDSSGVHLEVKPTMQNLTPRELEVLTYIAKGLSKKEIANLMHLSVKTVENHTANVMGRLDIHDRVQLTRLAIREGLIEP
ncbi:MAG: response regulator transcription factor [Phycisphaerae bacterium]|jgi:DNA-binding NarL/FixJ family response regulator